MGETVVPKVWNDLLESDAELAIPDVKWEVPDPSLDDATNLKRTLYHQPNSSILDKIPDHSSARKRIVRRSNKTKELFVKLMKACENGDLEDAERFITEGAVVNGIHASKTPLYVAAEGNHLGIVVLLLKLGSSIDSGSSNGATPLHIAAEKGHIQVMEHLLQSGANINGCTIHLFGSDQKSKSPLAAAVSGNRMDAATFLLSKGADVDNPAEYSPLCVAAQNGSLEMVKLLIEHSANLTVGNPEEGCSPLFLAAEGNHWKIAKLLIEKGANQNIHWHKNTLLMLATVRQQLELMKVLLESKVDIESVNRQGASALHLAVDMGAVDATRILLEHGAAVDRRTNTMDSERNSLFTVGQLNLCMATSMVGVTPLHIAAENGSLEIAKLLIEHGANLTETSGDSNRIPLSIAVFKGNLRMVRFLVDSKPSTVNHLPESPLMIACDRNYFEIIKLLLYHRASVKEMGSLNNLFGAAINGTALDIAISRGHPETIKLLKEIDAGIRKIPKWQPSDYLKIPKQDRMTVRATMMSAKKSSLLQSLPKDILFAIFDLLVQIPLERKEPS